MTLPTLEDLARVALDFAPAAGNEAPDRVLGPWADELSATNPRHQRLWLTAVAAACFFPPDAEERSPFEQWSRRPPLPPVESRAAFRAIARTPWSLWRLDENVGDRWHVEDLIGLPTTWTPRGTVLLDPRSGFVEPRSGDILAARVIKADDGWVAVTPVVARCCPPERALARWKAEFSSTGSLKQLCDHGQVLALRLCERAWWEETERTARGPSSLLPPISSLLHQS